MIPRRRQRATTRRVRRPPSDKKAETLEYSLACDTMDQYDVRYVQVLQPCYALKRPHTRFGRNSRSRTVAIPVRRSHYASFTCDTHSILAILLILIIAASSVTSRAGGVRRPVVWNKMC